jgi:predicted HicB family RNase H-like nuclease
VPGRNEEVKLEDTDTGRTIIVRLKIETHKALRIRVAEEDTSIQKWVEALIERELGVAKASSRSRR